MRKSIIGAVCACLMVVSVNVSAALVMDTILEFDSSIGCPVGAQCVWNDGLVYGSYFGMDTNADGVFQEAEKTAISSGYDGGIIIGRTQLPGFSIPESPAGAGIDTPWDYFGSTGWHESTSPISVVNDYGSTKELNFSGWAVNFDGVRYDLGADELATITCETFACADGETYTLDYSTLVPNDTFIWTPYVLHLEGTISAVPAPAAVWLFGSGLIGLIGIARRKKVK